MYYSDNGCRGRILQRGLLALLLVLTPSIVFADASDAWFERMSNAFTQLNYDGVFIYTNGSSLDTLRIVHKVEQGIERERIVRLDGPQQEIIRQGDQVTCIHGTDWNGNIDHKIPEGPFARAFVRDMKELGESYELVEKGNGRVAGRDAKILQIRPRDDYRYGYHIWIDQASGLLLKSILVHRGKVLGRFQFTQLDLSGDIPETSLEVGISGENRVHYPLLGKEEPPLDPKALTWRLDWLPAGFEMRMQGSRRALGGGRGADTLTFTDGMAAFSVFIEKVGDQHYEEVSAQKGATVAVSRIVNYPGGDHLVTVVGEVPMKTAKRIALSVVPVVPVAASDHAS